MNCRYPAVFGKKKKPHRFQSPQRASVEPLGSRLVLFYLSEVIDLKFFFRLDFEPVLQICLYIKGKLGIGICCVLVLGMLRQIVLLGVERTDALHLDDAAAGGHDGQLIHAHQFFATLSSDEFKKTAAAKKNLCGCRSNWRLEAKKSPVVPGK